MFDSASRGVFIIKLRAKPEKCRINLPDRSIEAMIVGCELMIVKKKIEEHALWV